MKLAAEITGSVRGIVDAELRDLAQAMRRGVADAGAAVHEELRAQLVGSLPATVVNGMFGVTIFPTEGTAAQNSLMPAAVVAPRKPKIVMALVDPIEIVARDGRYLTFPTPYNRNRSGSVKVQIGDMVRARGQTFVIASRSDPAVKLWCLRGGAAVDMNMLRRDEAARALGRQIFPTQQRNFIPMFFLLKTVRTRKRLDIELVRHDAVRILHGTMSSAMIQQGPPA